MATWSPFMEGLTKNFFKCPVCLDQFNEPKQLPCLHRFCNGCLRTVIQASHDGTIECPLCKQRCRIPKDGLDGFKTDFHMKSMLEFIELHKSLEKKDLKQCVSCLKHVVCSAYCFKCRDFLCNECYKVNISSKMFTDHQPSTLKLENMAAKNLTMEEIAAMTEDPRCHFHIKEPAKLCCGTCQNEPVCLVCTHGKHKGHDLIDVNDLAQKERTLLNQNLAELSKLKAKQYALPEKVQMALVKLNENVTKKTKLLTIQHEEQAKKIKDKLAKCNKEREKGAADIENRRGCEKHEITVKHEEEMNRLIMKHQENMKSTDVKYDQELKEFKDNCKETEGEFFKKLGELYSNFKTLTTAKDLLTCQNKNECEEILNKCKQLIKRFENLSATSSSILACNDDWTDAQCFPDIRAASEPMIEEMKQEYPELESLSDFVISDITKFISDKVVITESPESVVDVPGIKAKGYRISGMTSSSDGNIVMTGWVSQDESHITVINMKGEILNQNVLNRKHTFCFRAYRYCCNLPGCNVITVCKPDEIGIYNISDSSYQKKNISGMVKTWPYGRYVWSVTTNPAKNQIIVGTNSREVYVFDYQLNYSHTIVLPDVIKHSDDITVHNGNLLICDNGGGTSYAVTMVTSGSKVLYKFTKPNLSRADLRPVSVCIGMGGFIYMLWHYDCGLLWEDNGELNTVLTQYSRDGRQLLTTMSVADDASCITTSVVDGEEKLMIATYSLGKMYIYGLVPA
ncbi:uncharacterized protein [Apostichopus japonicus]|uniref:uncharacterized protein isoform X1 n=1 Tax=Stichopus japonicus TaxID=307972 RepID=UPI003AB70988